MADIFDILRDILTKAGWKERGPDMTRIGEYGEGSIFLSPDCKEIISVQRDESPSEEALNEFITDWDEFLKAVEDVTDSEEFEDMDDDLKEYEEHYENLATPEYNLNQFKRWRKEK